MEEIKPEGKSRLINLWHYFVVMGTLGIVYIVIVRDLLVYLLEKMEVYLGDDMTILVLSTLLAFFLIEAHLYNKQNNNLTDIPKIDKFLVFLLPFIHIGAWSLYVTYIEACDLCAFALALPPVLLVLMFVYYGLRWLSLKLKIVRIMSLYMWRAIFHPFTEWRLLLIILAVPAVVVILLLFRIY